MVLCNEKMELESFPKLYLINAKKDWINYTKSKCYNCVKRRTFFDENVFS